MEKITIQIGKDFKQTYVMAVTSAPKAYDGFGTFTVRELGPNEFKPADTDRLVMIQENMLNWQTMRNSSGMYPTWTEAEDNPYCDDYAARTACNILFSKLSGLGE